MLFCSKLGIKVNKLYIDKCPLCEKSSFEKVMTCTDHYATGESFDLYRCKNCGFLFTQNAPVEAEIGRYYESPDYISHSDTKKGLMNSVYHRVRLLMLRKKVALVKHCSRLNNGNILDIGTGTGYFANAMNKAGWKVSAIEKNGQARDFAKEHFGIDVAPPEYLYDIEEKSLDVITLWHVMEHLEQLNRTWETLGKILKDSGTLIIAVPNSSSFDAGKYNEMWAAYDVPRHLWHFTPSTMQQMGLKHGFVLSERYPMPFDAFYVSMLTEKYKNNSFTFIRGLVMGFRAWIASLMKKDKSSSMIYIFRKK